MVFTSPTHPLPFLYLCICLQFDINQLMTSVNVSQSLSPIHKPAESPSSNCSSSNSGNGSVGGASGGAVEQSPVDRTKGFFPDESEPLLRCDSTSSKDSALSRNGSFITKGERASCGKTLPYSRRAKTLLVSLCCYQGVTDFLVGRKISSIYVIFFFNIF